MGAMTKTTRAVHLSLDSIALSLRVTKAKGYFYYTLSPEVSPLGDDGRLLSASKVYQLAYA